VQGAVHGDEVELRAVMDVPGNPVHWTFKGDAQGGNMKGKVSMGEYADATWSAVRA
jgi:hypothetical protein